VAAPESMTARPRPERHTLLIVDDERDVLDSLRHLFHRSYRVLLAESGEEALAILAREDVHVILSDQRMPGMTGDAVLAEARKNHPDAIRMLFTGYADLEAVIRAVNEGNIYRYIVKPWDSAELESVIRQAVEQYELLAERKRLIAELREANRTLVGLNESLAEASQLKTAFIEVAGHEFNTPITLVLGLSELLLLTDPNRGEGDRQIIEQISRSARQLARLVADTLTLMRANEFRRTLHAAPVDLGLLLHEAADRLMPFVERRQLRFLVDIPADLGTFEVDPPKVRDAVLNLLTNALKFTPDGGEISLSARLTAVDQAEIVIADRGIGMEPRAVKRLFEPFFTEFDPSRHSTGDFGFEKRGLGLGLSIVRQFVELHGGRIAAESEPGRGTRVTIHLPRRPFPEARSEVELDVPGNAG
jgi:signal transduction histidine kinase